MTFCHIEGYTSPIKMFLCKTNLPNRKEDLLYVCRGRPIINAKSCNTGGRMTLSKKSDVWIYVWNIIGDEKELDNM